MMDVRKDVEVTTQFDTLLADLNKSAQDTRVLCDELLEVIASQNATFMTPALRRIQDQLDNQIAEMSMQVQEYDQQYLAWLAAIKADAEDRYEEWLKKMNFLKHEADEFAIREMLDKEAESLRNLQAMNDAMVKGIIKRSEVCIVQLTAFKTVLDERLKKADEYLAKIDFALKNEHKQFKIKGVQLAVQIKANQHPTFHSDIYNTDYLHDRILSLHDKYEQRLMTFEEYKTDLRSAHRNAMHSHVRDSMPEAALNKTYEDHFSEFLHHVIPHQSVIARLAAAKADAMHIKAETDAARISADIGIQQNREIARNTRLSDSRESLVQRDASILSTEQLIEKGREMGEKHDLILDGIKDFLDKLAMKKVGYFDEQESFDIDKSVKSQETKQFEEQTIDSSKTTKNITDGIPKQIEGQPEPHLDISDEQPGAPVSPNVDSVVASESPDSITDEDLAQLEAMTKPKPDITDEQPGAPSISEPAKEISEHTLTELESKSDPQPDLELADEQPGALSPSNIASVEAPETIEGIGEETLAELEGIIGHSSDDEKLSVQAESEPGSIIDESIHRNAEDQKADEKISIAQQSPIPVSSATSTEDASHANTKKESNGESKAKQPDDINKRHGEPDPNRSDPWGEKYKREKSFASSISIPDKKQTPKDNPSDDINTERRPRPR